MTININIPNILRGLLLVAIITSIVFLVTTKNMLWVIPSLILSIIGIFDYAEMQDNKSSLKKKYKRSRH